MLSRLCEEAAMIHYDRRNEILSIKSEIDLQIEQIINDVLKGTSFEIIPIQKLVKVQVGSALITMKHLYKKK